MPSSLHTPSTANAASLHPIHFESCAQLVQKLIPGVTRICFCGRAGRVLWSSDGVEDCDVTTHAQRLLTGTADEQQAGPQPGWFGVAVRTADGAAVAALMLFCAEVDRARPSYDPETWRDRLAPLTTLIGHAWREMAPQAALPEAQSMPASSRAPIVGPAGRATTPSSVLRRTLILATERAQCAFAVFIATEQSLVLTHRVYTDESQEAIRDLADGLRVPMTRLVSLRADPVSVTTDDPLWVRSAQYKFVVCPVRAADTRLAGLLVLFRTRIEPNFNAADRIVLLHVAKQIPTHVLNALLPNPALSSAALPHVLDTPVVVPSSDVLEMPLERRIRAALRRDGFELHAQQLEPLRDPSRPARHEVLVRMRDGERLLLPEAFFDTAAAHDLLPELDRWVVSRLLKSLQPHAQAVQARQWEFGVNVSVQSLLRESFGDFVESQLARSAVPAQALIFEFGERDVLQHRDCFEPLATRLHALGCRIALEHCREGLAVFGAIRHLPIACLKLDASLIQRITSDARAARIVREVAEVASDIGMETVGAPIESAEACTQLRAFPVDFAQGFQVSRPRPLSDLLDWIGKGDGTWGVGPGTE